MTPASLLLLGLLPATVAGTGETSRVQLDLAPELLLASGAPGSIGVGTALGLRATLFVDRVVDDATPLPLQPYLQRASTVWLRVAGARFEPRSTMLAGSIDAGADVYLRSVVYLGGSIGVSGLHVASVGPQANLHRVPVRAATAVGLRLGELQIDIGLRFQPRADTVPYWYGHQRLPDGAPMREEVGVTLGLRAVLVERIDLQLRMAISLETDVYGAFTCNYHTSRRLGLLWGIDFQHGPAAVHQSDPAFGPIRTWAPIYDRFGAHFGVAWWWTRRLGVTGTYAVEWYFPVDSIDDPGGVGQHFIVELSTRI